MKELTALPIWAHCSNKVKTLKAPAVGLGKTKPIAYDKARANAERQIAGSPYYGMVFTDDCEYIGIDIDVDPSGKKANATKEIPIAVLQFLQDHPTHAHYSPSGHGLHIIYKLSHNTVRALEERKIQQLAVKESDGTLFDGDIRFRRGFLVFTDKEHALSIPEISELKTHELKKLAPSLLSAPKSTQEVRSVDEDIDVLDSLPNVPTLQQLKQVLETLPPTYNSIVERATKSLPYSKPTTNYEYWVMVGNACAHHAVLLEMCGRVEDSDKVVSLFHSWSKQDTEGYTSEGEVIDKFNGLRKATIEKINNKVKTITIGSLFLLAKHCVIDFPDMLSSKGKLRPDPLSIDNIKKLIEHDELELVFDPMAGGVCFKGPEDTIVKWFCPMDDYKAIRPTGYSQVAMLPDMSIRFRPYMQNRYGFSVSSTHAKDAIDYLAQNMKQENAFKYWIESEPWDKVKRFDDVCASIKISIDEEKNTSVYQSYIRRALLSMVGIHFWPEDSPKIPAMIVLSGPEYTYKSSWAEWLIPQYMGNYIATADTETALTGGREWQMFLSTKAVVVINECETMFAPRYEQKVKASVDSETVTYRDLYAKTVMTRPRTALIIGTTNKNSLFTGSTGTRKIWQIPVDECDSMLVKHMNLQQLYAEVYYVLKRYKRAYPQNFIQMAWAQSDKDRDITNKLNAEKKGADIGVLGLLIERFGHFHERTFQPADYVDSYGKYRPRIGVPFSLDNTPNAWNVTGMMKFLSIEYPEDKIDRISVKYALEEYAANYTGTLHKPKALFKSFIKNDRKAIIVKRGCSTCWFGQTLYHMPPPIEVNNSIKEGVDEQD